MSRQKSVSLTLRGFESTAQEVELLMGKRATVLGNRGEKVRPNVEAILSRSYVLYRRNFEEDSPMDNMISLLLADLGGFENVENAKKLVSPEYVEFAIDLPVKSSEEGQEGYLTDGDTSAMARLGASLAFSFF